MMKTQTIALMVVISVSGAYAQQIGDRATLNSLLASSTTDDFESYNISSGSATGMNVTFLDSLTIVNGQGPGLVNVGATYSDPSILQMQWNGDQYFGLNSKTILSNGSTGAIRIDYSGGVHAMGLDARAFSGFGYSGVMDVYNGATSVGSIGFSLTNGGSESVFLGWQNGGGITHVIVSSGAFSWSPIIDDHTYGAVPEPMTMAVLGAGLAFLSRRRKSA